MDTRVKLRVQGLTSSMIQSGAYALVLAEEDGIRRMPIIVGTAEAQSIAIALERIIPPRPLTHDLFMTFSQAFGVRLLEVFIYKFKDGVFYSELLFDDGSNQVRIDSRTSDAIAIALRIKCDIYTTEEIIDLCGVTLEEQTYLESDGMVENEENPGEISDEDLAYLSPMELTSEEEKQRWMKLISLNDLKEYLSDAIECEDYELAKVLQDELTARQEKGETKE